MTRPCGGSLKAKTAPVEVSGRRSGVCQLRARPCREGDYASAPAAYTTGRSEAITSEIIAVKVTSLAISLSFLLAGSLSGMTVK